MINRNCTCSREPLMALNLHQARTGGRKRKSQEQRQPASHYTLNLYPHTQCCTHALRLSLLHARTHTRARAFMSGVPTGDSPDSGPQHPAFHISFLGTFPFHFKCITFQTFPFWPYQPPPKQRRPLGVSTPAPRTRHSPTSEFNEQLDHGQRSLQSSPPQYKTARGPLVEYRYCIH